MDMVTLDFLMLVILIIDLKIAMPRLFDSKIELVVESGGA